MMSGHFVRCYLRSLNFTTTCDGITNVFLNLFTSDTSPGGEVKRLKLKPDVHELSQCLATAITFGTIQSTWISHNSYSSRRLRYHSVQSWIWPFIDKLFRLDKKGIVNSVDCRTLQNISYKAWKYARSPAIFLLLPLLCKTVPISPKRTISVCCS